MKVASYGYEPVVTDGKVKIHNTRVKNPFKHEDEEDEDGSDLSSIAGYFTIAFKTNQTHVDINEALGYIKTHSFDFNTTSDVYLDFRGIKGKDSYLDVAADLEKAVLKIPSGMDKVKFFKELETRNINVVHEKIKKVCAAYELIENGNLQISKWRDVFNDFHDAALNNNAIAILRHFLNVVKSLPELITLLFLRKSDGLIIPWRFGKITYQKETVFCVSASILKRTIYFITNEQLSEKFNDSHIKHLMMTFSKRSDKNVKASNLREIGKVLNVGWCQPGKRTKKDEAHGVKRGHKLIYQTGYANKIASFADFYSCRLVKTTCDNCQDMPKIPPLLLNYNNLQVSNTPNQDHVFEQKPIFLAVNKSKVHVFIAYLFNLLFVSDKDNKAIASREISSPKGKLLYMLWMRYQNNLQDDTFRKRYSFMLALFTQVDDIVFDCTYKDVKGTRVYNDPLDLAKIQVQMSETLHAISIMTYHAYNVCYQLNRKPSYITIDDLQRSLTNLDKKFGEKTASEVYKLFQQTIDTMVGEKDIQPILDTVNTKLLLIKQNSGKTAAYYANHAELFENAANLILDGVEIALHDIKIEVESAHAYSVEANKLFNSGMLTDREITGIAEAANIAAAKAAVDADTAAHAVQAAAADVQAAAADVKAAAADVKAAAGAVKVAAAEAAAGAVKADAEAAVAKATGAKAAADAAAGNFHTAVEAVARLANKAKGQLEIVNTQIFIQKKINAALKEAGTNSNDEVAQAAKASAKVQALDKQAALAAEVQEQPGVPTEVHDDVQAAAVYVDVNKFPFLETERNRLTIPDKYNDNLEVSLKITVDYLSKQSTNLLTGIREIVKQCVSKQVGIDCIKDTDLCDLPQFNYLFGGMINIKMIRGFMEFRPFNDYPITTLIDNLILVSDRLSSLNNSSQIAEYLKDSMIYAIQTGNLTDIGYYKELIDTLSTNYNGDKVDSEHREEIIKVGIQYTNAISALHPYRDNGIVQIIFDNFVRIFGNARWLNTAEFNELKERVINVFVEYGKDIDMFQDDIEFLKALLNPDDDEPDDEQADEPDDGSNIDNDAAYHDFFSIKHVGEFGAMNPGEFGNIVVRQVKQAELDELNSVTKELSEKLDFKQRQRDRRTRTTTDLAGLDAEIVEMKRKIDENTKTIKDLTLWLRLDRGHQLKKYEFDVSNEEKKARLNAMRENGDDYDNKLIDELIHDIEMKQANEKEQMTEADIELCQTEIRKGDDNRRLITEGEGPKEKAVAQCALDVITTDKQIQETSDIIEELTDNIDNLNGQLTDQNTACIASKDSLKRVKAAYEIENTPENSTAVKDAELVNTANNKTLRDTRTTIRNKHIHLRQLTIKLDELKQRRPEEMQRLLDKINDVYSPDPIDTDRLWYSISFAQMLQTSFLVACSYNTIVELGVGAFEFIPIPGESLITRPLMDCDLKFKIIEKLGVVNTHDFKTIAYGILVPVLDFMDCLSLATNGGAPVTQTGGVKNLDNIRRVIEEPCIHLYKSYIYLLENPIDVSPTHYNKLLNYWRQILLQYGIYAPLDKEPAFNLGELDVNKNHDIQCEYACLRIFNRSMNEMIIKLSKGELVGPFGYLPYLNPDPYDLNTICCTFLTVRMLHLRFPNSCRMSIYFKLLSDLINDTDNFEENDINSLIDDICEGICRGNFFDKIAALKKEPRKLSYRRVDFNIYLEQYGPKGAKYDIHEVINTFNEVFPQKKPAEAPPVPTAPMTPAERVRAAIAIARAERGKAAVPMTPETATAEAPPRNPARQRMSPKWPITWPISNSVPRPPVPPATTAPMTPLGKPSYKADINFNSPTGVADLSPAEMEKIDATANSPRQSNNTLLSSSIKRTLYDRMGETDGIRIGGKTLRKRVVHKKTRNKINRRSRKNKN